MGHSLERGEIPIDECPGGIDLTLTLESGQSYHWRRDGGTMYSEIEPEWYYSIIDGELIRVAQTESTLQWESTTDGEAILRRVLRLDDDLDDIFSAIPKDSLIERAFQSHRGMRVVRDPPFVCLISFICSTQMRVSRIHGMVTRLSSTYGDRVRINDREYCAFPRPDQLVKRSETDLRNLSLGYRAPYVRETSAIVANEIFEPSAVGGLDYEQAREELTRFVGVGNKVADCVLLFSLGYLEAVPLDTWIRNAISTYYPECDLGTYHETSRAIRRKFGSEYAGYAQTYLFHHLRTGSVAREDSVPR